MKVRAIAGGIVEFAGVSLYSLLIGIIIGSVQHTLGDMKLARSEGLASLVRFSILEGGFVGALFAIPTGWFCYYAIFGRRARKRDWMMVTAVVGSVAIVIGLVIGLFIPDLLFFSSLVMPLITVYIAAVLASRNRATQ